MIHKILFVSRFMKGGGAERVISVLTGELVEQGYSIGIMSYVVTDEDYDIDKRVKKYSMGDTYSENSGNAISRTLYRINRLKQVISEYKPDIIIPFLEPIVREVYVAVGNGNIPIVATVRNLPVYNSIFQKKLYHYIYEHCSMIFFQTKSQQRYFSQKIIERSFVLPNPVDIRFVNSGEKRNKSKKIINIVTAGRLSEQKNHKILLDAMMLVHKSHPECYLKIYGEGTKRTELESYVSERHANSFIQIMQRSNNLVDVYKNSDLFVLSSNYEGMPNALMEAMASGIPCISTDCPTGPKELLGKNIRGLLVSMNDVVSLSEAIIRMVENPERAHQYALCAHNYIKGNFTPEKIAIQFIKCCENMI